MQDWLGNLRDLVQNDNASPWSVLLRSLGPWQQNIKPGPGSWSWPYRCGQSLVGRVLVIHPVLCRGLGYNYSIRNGLCLEGAFVVFNLLPPRMVLTWKPGHSGIAPLFLGPAVPVTLMCFFQFSKKILTLGLNQDPPPHPNTLRLQRMIRYSATLFVQVKPSCGGRNFSPASPAFYLSEGRPHQWLVFYLYAYNSL